MEAQVPLLAAWVPGSCGARAGARARGWHADPAGSACSPTQARAPIPNRPCLALAPATPQAEVRALAKAMLRRKVKDDIIEAAYNRYAL